MKKFATGNVIRSPYGSLEIVIKNDDENYIMCIPLDGANITIGHPREDIKRITSCFCDNDPDCEDCHGTGQYEEITLGFERAEFVASTVKSYIKESLLKNFNF